MMRTVWLLGVCLVALPFLGVPAVAEDPHNQDCEGVAAVRLLCAGADAGTNGDCTNTSPAEIDCWYTYGWNLNASSAAQLPGEGVLEWSFEVFYCIDHVDCGVIEQGGGVLHCEWLVNELHPCHENHVDGGDVDFVLELGECVVVTAHVTVFAQAWSVDREDPLFSASAQQESEQGGAACYLDDGRD